MADAVFEMANLKASEYNFKPIDFVLLIMVALDQAYQVVI